MHGDGNAPSFVFITAVSLHRHIKFQQKAQQRFRAMLRVIEYFAKSLKVIRNDFLRTYSENSLVCRMVWQPNGKKV